MMSVTSLGRTIRFDYKVNRSLTPYLVLRNGFELDLLIISKPLLVSQSN